MLGGVWLSTAMPAILVESSSFLPPRYVENTSPLPAALSSVTKASEAPPACDCVGLLVGKLVDVVVPVTYAFRAESSAMASPSSAPPPPR